MYISNYVSNYIWIVAIFYQANSQSHHINLLYFVMRPVKLKYIIELNMPEVVKKFWENNTFQTWQDRYTNEFCGGDCMHKTCTGISQLKSLLRLGAWLLLLAEEQLVPAGEAYVTWSLTSFPSSSEWPCF